MFLPDEFKVFFEELIDDSEIETNFLKDTL